MKQKVLRIVCKYFTSFPHFEYYINRKRFCCIDDHDQEIFCVGEMVASKVRICLLHISITSFHISPIHAVNTHTKENE